MRTKKERARADSDRAEDGAEEGRRKLPARIVQPSQFQRFVQESTGQLLPIFGRELFESPQTYAADSAIPAPDSYVLGSGDEIQLKVWGPVDFSLDLTIDRNGQVNLPKVGVVQLGGVMLRDLDKTLSRHLAKVYANFNASATLGRLRGIQIYVVGHALQPGSYHVSSLSTLVNALFVSGGPTAGGSMRNISLKRNGKTISTIDLYDFIARGDKSKDLALLSGDVIVIPPVGPRVAVTGAIDQAAIFELKPSATTVADILSLGGGVPTLATVNKALLERIVRDSNPPRQVQEIVLNEPGLRQNLRDGDVLVLFGISPAFANAVTLQGAVAAPLRYNWFEGMRVLDLIPDREALITGDYFRRKNLLVQNERATSAAGLDLSKRIRAADDQINWDYAVIERMDKNTLTTALIPFNLGKAVLQKDPAHNLPLQVGDVITVLNQSDLRVPQERQARLVRLEGEVVAPGVYQANPGETLPDLIQRIGGLTPQAYLFGSEFRRESVRAKQQAGLDTLIRRLEAQGQAQANSLVANRGTDAAGLALAQQQQQQQQLQLKAQVERLKDFKSNGRMTLELDTQSKSLAALPALPLEDGDAFYIPSVPGFVSAFGAVHNENLFLFKQGKTVADVLKSAGLTEEADLDQAFVLRADGSVMARRDQSSLLGGGFEARQLMPGDTVVVPSKIDRESTYSVITRGVKDWTQILANFGLSVAALKSIKSL
ncbi:polysaccharide biosynthesis/export family protein [Roseateles oligotrophus]|uniref:SLBB domain-containing protein n=1 Tax=Roseateles oligotrophus TaxID=1769250 RepID=A0ABT2YE18_9BURK|nr:SLBB domain-containing protein [Roseateles oligotrophus]MCV2368266.1 SLBB domain-containing protein [Roseateles oligotrophus]